MRAPSHQGVRGRRGSIRESGAGAVHQLRRQAAWPQRRLAPRAEAAAGRAQVSGVTNCRHAIAVIMPQEVAPRMAGQAKPGVLQAQRPWRARWSWVTRRLAVSWSHCHGHHVGVGEGGRHSTPESAEVSAGAEVAAHAELVAQLGAIQAPAYDIAVSYQSAIIGITVLIM